MSASPAVVSVSVIVPVYRVEGYVVRCVESLAGQSVRPHEVLLVDDCGGDDSIALASGELARHGVDHRVLRHEVNRGLSAARNTGLAHATGDVVWFLDSDDRAHPSFLEHMLDRLSQDGSDLVVCRTSRVDPAGRPLGIDEPAYPAKTCTGTELARLLLAGAVRGYAWNKVFRRHVLGEDPFPVGMRYEDLPVVLDIALRADSVSLTDRVLYDYTRTPGSLSNDFGEGTFDLLKALELIEGSVGRAGHRWRRLMTRHRYVDGLLPLANMALRARYDGTGCDADEVLVERAIAAVRARTRLTDLGVLAATGQARSAAAAALLALRPSWYTAVLRHQWGREECAEGPGLAQ